MLKKCFKATLICMWVVAAAATVNAATIEANLYVASAQHNLWNLLSTDFCTDSGYNPVAGGVRCDVLNKHCILECHKDSDTIIIRNSIEEIFDAFYAATGTSVPAALGEQSSCSSFGIDYREMAGSYADPDTLICKKIAIGAGNMQGDAYGDETHGETDGKGTDEDNEWVDRVVQKISFTPDYPKTLVLPYGFFVNSTALPDIDNLTHLQAALAFSGTFTNWADFCGGSASNPSG